MNCKHCGKDNPGKRRFCADCGAPLPAPCPACGFANEAGDKFCGGCGQALGAAGAGAAPAADAQGELRHVVVLFCDLENYTGLSGRLDPDDVHTLLGRFFTAVDGVVAGYGGTIDKHIGDNVMALFGAPIAHGNDAERAARAALDIHREVAALAQESQQPLRVNIGIAAGQVMASGLGSDHHREYTVIGNAVNIAARLQGVAKHGETVIEDSVYRAIAGIAMADDAGPQTLKGVAVPVRAWKLRAIADSSTGESRQLIGREPEMRTLAHVLEQAVATKHGQVVLLRAEAGAGKSRLAHELGREAAVRGFAAHRFGFVDFGAADRGLPAFLRELVVPAWRAALQAGEPMQYAHLCATLDEPLPPALLGPYQALSNVVRLDGRLKVLGSLAGAAAHERPLLLVMEDLQWIKPEGRLVLQAFAAAAREHPIVLLLTARPEASDTAWWKGFEAEHPPHVLNLAPLSAEASRELAAALGADESLRAQLIARAAGNPLYLEELVSSIREGRDAQAVPGTVQGLVLARLDRLPAPDQRALQHASVLGMRFTLPLLRALLEDSAYDAAVPIARHLLAGEGEQLAFRHALIRDGVYASLTKERRRELHRRAAALGELLGAVDRAEHLDRAGDPAAVKAYLDAAAGESAAYRYASAQRLLDRARELARDEDAVAVDLARGDLFQALSDGPRAIAAFRAAGEATRSDAARCRAALGEATAQRGLSELVAASAAIERAAGCKPDERQQVAIHYLRACILFSQSRYVQSGEQAGAALAIAERIQDPAWQARALSALGDVSWGLGRMHEAREEYRRCVALCESQNLLRFAIPNRTMQCHVMAWMGDLEGGAALLAPALAQARMIQDRYAEMFAIHTMGMISQLRGDFATARGEVLAALELARSLAAARFESELLTQLAEIQVERGEDAEPAAREGVEIARRRNVLSYLGPWLLGALARTTRDPAERERLRLEGEAMIAAGTSRHCELTFYSHLLAAALDAGDRTMAASYLGRLEQGATDSGCSFQLRNVARARERLGAARP